MKGLKNPTWRFLLSGVSGVILTAVSALSLVWIIPFAQKMAANQPFFAPILFNSATGKFFLPFITLCIAGFAYFRYWTLVLSLFGVAIFALTTSYAMFWHSCFLFPLFMVWFLTDHQNKKLNRQFNGVLVLAIYLFLARFEFGARPWSLKSFVKEVEQYSSYP